MNITHLDRSDPTVNQIVSAAYPDYTGRKISARVAETITFANTMWFEGSRNEYKIVDLSTMQIATVPMEPYLERSDLHEKSFKLTKGFVVVVLETFRGKDSIEIVSCADNITKLLAAPVELTKEEKIVLTATRSYKSSYAGIKNYRYHEAKRNTGITLDAYEVAKTNLISKGFLNKAGAITNDGRNAIGSTDLGSLRLTNHDPYKY